MNKHLTHSDTFVDFKNRRAILPKGSNASLSLTRVEDVAQVVVKALAFKGEWPIRGGISGNKVTLEELLKLGARVRGKSIKVFGISNANLNKGEKFVVDNVNIEDLKLGKLTSSWRPMLRHPSFSPEEVRHASEQFSIQSLLAIAKGGWEMSDEWNIALPDLQFADLAEVLQASWQGEL